ncbi:MAG: hypothetical protein V4733_05090 [Verrucomicrobiota bacterium]
MRITTHSGLSFDFHPCGTLHRIDHGSNLLNLYPGNPLDGGLTNVHLRVLGNTPACVPLFGPASTSRVGFSDRHMIASGNFRGLAYRVIFLPAENITAWFWHVEIVNETGAPVECDLILTQDTGIANYNLIRQNEFFVSQYIDHQALTHPRFGTCIASRQNQPMDKKFPWLLTGTLGRAVSFATDALQTHGHARDGNFPMRTSGLPGTRLQHEHSLVSLQLEAFVIPPGESTRRSFFAIFQVDQPTRTSSEDLIFADQAAALPEARFPDLPVVEMKTVVPNLFQTAENFPALELDDASLLGLLPNDQRHIERSKDDAVLSYFSGTDAHVVARAKESAALRPHGHMLRTGGGITPDESSLTSTVWMAGVFHSLVTQGHVGINRFLSSVRGYLGFYNSHGLRIFVETEDTWQRLALPSAFVIHRQSCRWIYHHQGDPITVTASASLDDHTLVLDIVSANPRRFLLTFHLATNGDDGEVPLPADVEISSHSFRVRAARETEMNRRFPDGFFDVTFGKPVTISGDETLFADGNPHGLPFVCAITEKSAAVHCSLTGHLIPPEGNVLAGIADTGLEITPPSSRACEEKLARIATIAPWFAHNAFVHFLTPRGLEQFSGGGWGTRDVSQGPVELLLSLGHIDAIRDLLVRVFRQQNPDGDWPQWFMFFERERGIRPDDSHGDIVYWPLLALAQYLLAGGDPRLLDEKIPFFSHDPAAPHETVREHMARALGVIRTRVIPDTKLAAYGHGDWNDALQPAKPEMREELCSSWTVTLNFQTLTALAAAFRFIGESKTADEFSAEAADVLADFQRLLMPGGTVAGLMWFGDGLQNPKPLLHPGDDETGLSYSLLPMIHAIINDLFTPAQARAHLDLIRNHLTGPDGARLFDKPIHYHGGERTWFQRAETATFFGREIGVMYMHAHLRYAEALARLGEAEALFEAVLQCIPIGVSEVIPPAAIRQANCYYSSSDGAFPDRYQADESYDDLIAGKVALEGGWRIYSSGAGIATRLIHQWFLGLRYEAGNLVVDPVLPPSLDGMTARFRVNGKMIHALYRVGTTGFGPSEISCNGQAVSFGRLDNPYRNGGALVPWNLIADEAELVITLG